MRRAILTFFMVIWAGMAAAQGFTGLARVDPETTLLSDTRAGMGLQIGLSQGVPWRIFTLDGPPRLVLDFREVDWRGADPAQIDRAEGALAVRMGAFRPGWSRMVVDLGAPYRVARADMAIDADSGAALLRVDLQDSTPDIFAARAGVPTTPGWDRQGRDDGMRAQPRPRQRGETPLVVVLDPGHGGIDPGADQGGMLEKDLMLQFALELKEVLTRAGDIEVVLTRDSDRFVSLERRVAIAHRVGADLFMSLHADALSEGRAHGATVYTLSDSASDAASAALAERHNRADMLAGVDLTGADDVVADVLMDLARMETQPRAEALARAIKLGLAERDLPLNTRALRAAGFSVLKSPDIPSVLVELGFLSSERDRANLSDAAWRARMARALADSIAAWRIADAAQADLVRQ